jgi:hypothetical protein
MRSQPYCAFPFRLYSLDRQTELTDGKKFDSAKSIQSKKWINLIVWQLEEVETG